MSLNAALIDQRVEGIRDEIKEMASEWFQINDAAKLKSLAFLYLCVQTLLDLDRDETFECLTEGGGDFGVDAIHLSDIVNDEFTVTVFQTKYKQKKSKGDANFPESGIVSLTRAITHLFDPETSLGPINDRLKTRVEAARSLIKDGVFPRIRAVACNNGLKWNEAGQKVIDNLGIKDRLTWEYVNHDTLLNLLQRKKVINTNIKLVGKAIFERMQFVEVCTGKMAVSEVAMLMKEHSDQLLEKNIRKYLGLHGNRVNEAIQESLLDEQKAPNFYLFNNGLTFVCTNFFSNDFQKENHLVKVEGLQIVNGGQTCMTILKTQEMLAARYHNDKETVNNHALDLPAEASVLVRIYKLPRDNEDIVASITKATNSQNPVVLRDFRSNDDIQQRIELSVSQLNFNYRRKRTEGPLTSLDITPGVAAEAILSVWRKKPHQAKFLIREHFDKLYDTIFDQSLNGAQLIIAVLIFGIAENHRKRLAANEPIFVHYASCFIAMQMGKILLKDLRMDLIDLNHLSFKSAKDLIEKNGESYFKKATEDVEKALTEMYSFVPSLQLLSATFRRSDLIDKLHNYK
jgi:AIPR protein